MKIHEYQGKEIFRKFGIPVPRGIPAFTVDEAVKAAQPLGGPVWVVKAQIHAGGRGKGGGVKVAKSLDEVRAARDRDPRHAARHAPDRPGGQKVRRLLIEEGADIKKELYVGMVVDRGTQRVALMASSEGGMDIEHVAATTPEKIHKVFVDPVKGLTDAEADDVARKIGVPEGSIAAGAHGAAGPVPRVRRDRRLARRDQSARGHRRRQGDRARRQAQLRLQRAVPPPRDRRDARPRRGGSRRRSRRRSSTSRTSRSTATSAASSTAPGSRWRRWTRSSSTAASPPTSSTSAAAPPRRR